MLLRYFYASLLFKTPYFLSAATLLLSDWQWFHYSLDTLTGLLVDFLTLTQMKEAS